ncbi:hypothetical protein PROFUN_02418 [Planoprotostelium fungivorum]|uniref:guanylate kinase n=1 Tax=Planoprotostelium fungivorum TaxID=1890364 RepID=A0A2P6NV21_9EUKA|nr:hypothetical protein PROFUN_02418 [Planoprotostelium fungivorum]
MCFTEQSWLNSVLFLGLELGVEFGAVAEGHEVRSMMGHFEVANRMGFNVPAHMEIPTQQTSSPNQVLSADLAPKRSDLNRYMISFISGHSKRANFTTIYNRSIMTRTCCGEPGPLKVKRLSPDAILPVRASALAAGYDLSAAHDHVIEPHGKTIVKTDLAIAVPEGTYGRIACRSSLAWKNHLDVGAGVIDADYRGNVGVVLFNHSNVPFQVVKGERIAQLVLERIHTPQVLEVEELDETDHSEHLHLEGIDPHSLTSFLLLSHIQPVARDACRAEGGTNLLNSSSAEQYDDQPFRRDKGTNNKAQVGAGNYGYPTQGHKVSSPTNSQQQQNPQAMKPSGIGSTNPPGGNGGGQMGGNQYQHYGYNAQQGAPGLNKNPTPPINPTMPGMPAAPAPLTEANGGISKPQPASYTQVGILEGATAALKLIAREKRGELKTGMLSVKDGSSGSVFGDTEVPFLLSQEVYNIDNKLPWSIVWKPESLSKSQPDIYIKDQKNNINMKKSITEIRAHLNKTLAKDEELDIWTAPDIPLLHNYSCVCSTKNKNCLGCSPFYKSSQCITDEVRSGGSLDMLRYEDEKNEVFVGHLTMNNSFSPQKRETHAFDTINTMYYSDDPDAYMIWGFIPPYDVLHLTEDDSLGVQLFDQRTFVDPSFLEQKAKVIYGIQKPGQTVVIPANWIYFTVRVGKGMSLSGSWNILRPKNLPDARRSVEMNRSVGIYRPFNLGSIVLNSMTAKFQEMNYGNNVDADREKQATADFLFRGLPILKVQVLEELLDERINLSTLAIIAYDAVAEQHRNGGIVYKGIAAHEVAQIRSQGAPAPEGNMSEREDEPHSCALCKYVLFNTRRSCTTCKSLDFCEVCFPVASQMHPHRFQLFRRYTLDHLIDLIDSIKSFIKDYEPEEVYKDPAPPSSDKFTSRKRPHAEVAAVVEQVKQNTHILGEKKDPVSAMPGQQPLPPGRDSYDSEEVIDCVCANNKDLGFMISCEKCLAWLHGKCVGISKRNEPAEYFCPRCTKKMAANAVSQRLVPGCQKGEGINALRITLQHDQEVVSQNAVNTHRPVVVVGPSGVGKGTLINRLMGDYPNNFGFSVSHTTRKPRPGEREGIEYHFTTVDVIQKEIEAGQFVEHANVHGNYYGTSKAAVQRVKESGKTCILDIDVQGAQQVKQSDLNARFLFISPPSYETLEARLRGRGTETEEAITKRLAGAKRELNFLESSPSFFDSVIVNDNLEKAYQDFKTFFGLN